MNTINNEEMKKIMLNVFKVFINYCDVNKLKYYVVGGTLLGAVRHQGFIPWDDDIDVAMPREDYEKFVKNYRDFDENYNVYAVENTENYVYPFAKFCDGTTLLKEDNFDCGVDLGIHIDVFPLDGLGDTCKQARKKLKSMKSTVRMYNRKLHQKAMNKNLFRRLFARFQMFIATFKKNNYYALKLNKMAKEYNFNLSNYVGFFTHSAQERRIMPASIYEGSIQMDFEGIRVNAMSGYKDFLILFYGDDYMEMPPEEKRVIHNREVWKK